MKFNYFILFAVISILIPFSSQARDKPKMNVAVMDLEISGNFPDKYQRSLSDRLSQEMFNTGRFIVLERRAIDKILSEHQLPLTGIMSKESVSKIGNLLGVDYLVLGSITDIGLLYSINLRMISVMTGEIVLARSIDCESTIEKIITRDLKRLARYMAYGGHQPAKLAFSIGYRSGWMPLKASGFDEIEADYAASPEYNPLYIFPDEFDTLRFQSIVLDIYSGYSSYYTIELGKILSENADIFFLDFSLGKKNDLTYLTERFFKTMIIPSVMIDLSFHAFNFKMPDLPDEIEYNVDPYSGEKYRIEKKYPGTLGVSLRAGFELKLIEHILFQARGGYFYALDTEVLTHKQCSPLGETIIHKAKFGGSGVFISGSVAIGL